MCEQTWTMMQRWEHLFFIHWPVSPEVVREIVPDELELDTFDGKAWIGIILFRMNGFKLRYFPFPYPFAFPEINVRTYVKTNHGAPAIYFVTLDAADARVVQIAKRWYHLPYYRAAMSFHIKGNTYQFDNRRMVGPSQNGETFCGEFHPAGEAFQPQTGTIAHWLTERYHFFTQDAQTNRIFGGEVYHEPWVLRPARGHIYHNTMLQTSPIQLLRKPVYIHYAKGVVARIGPVNKKPLETPGKKRWLRT